MIIVSKNEKDLTAISQKTGIPLSELQEAIGHSISVEANPYKILTIPEIKKLFEKNKDYPRTRDRLIKQWDELSLIEINSANQLPKAIYAYFNLCPYSEIRHIAVDQITSLCKNFDHFNHVKCSSITINDNFLSKWIKICQNEQEARTVYFCIKKAGNLKEIAYNKWITLAQGKINTDNFNDIKLIYEQTFENKIPDLPDKAINRLIELCQNNSLIMDVYHLLPNHCFETKKILFNKGVEVSTTIDELKTIIDHIKMFSSLKAVEDKAIAKWIEISTTIQEVKEAFEYTQRDTPNGKAAILKIIDLS